MNSDLKNRYKAQLSSVDAAIDRIERGGQSSNISGAGGSSAVNQADYNALLKQRKELEIKIYGRGFKRARQIIGA